MDTDINADVKRKAQQKLLTTTDPLDKLRQSCLLRGVNGIRGFGRTFKIFDDNGDRKLSMNEFVMGCRDYGCDLKQSEASEIFRQIDANNDGNVSFDELLMAMRPPMSQARKDLIRQAFEKLDKTGDGQITVADLKGVYNAKMHKKYRSGEMTEDQVFIEYLKTFESRPGDVIDGIITRQEFENYYSGVSASIDDDIYFDYMMRQAWKL